MDPSAEEKGAEVGGEMGRLRAISSLVLICVKRSKMQSLRSCTGVA